MYEKFASRHIGRDLAIPHYRKILMDNALQDLASDPDVLAIYLSGSLAKGNFDTYSDIDLHTIVKPEQKGEFIKNKCIRAEKWGEVLFHEDANPSGPVVVTHYASFVKIDSWYHKYGEISASIWLKNIKVLHDPNNLLSEIVRNSTELSHSLEATAVELWKSKVLAFAHETYRAVMRDEGLHAESNLDQMRWLVVFGWYIEMNEHFDASYGSWSKVEGERSLLTEEQLSLLKSWKSGKNADEVMATLKKMVPEILRLNKILSEKKAIDVNQEKFKKILEMAY